MSDARCISAEVAIDDGEGRWARRLRLRLRTTLGRDEDNDISLPDPMVSRHHAEFRLRDGAFHLVDLDSVNGSYVNNVRVLGERTLRNGDTVTVGGTSLVFRDAEASSVPEEGCADGVVSAPISDEETTRTTTRALDVLDLGQEDHGLGLVCQVTNALVACRPLPDVFDKVLEAILDSIPAQRAAILLLEGQPPVPVVKATRACGGTVERAIRFDIVERALGDRKAILACDVEADAAVHTSATKPVHPIHSVMCAPLWSNLRRKGDGRLSGFIYLEGQDDRPPLTKRDLHILTMLANITATKIENARLLEDRAQKQRIEEDMRRAAEIQSDLLPRSSPSIEGYSVCGTTEPFRMVGGDYFDFEDDGQTLHLALADVSGKGTAAAMLMVALRATVRAHWRSGSLTAAAERINRTFHQTVPPDKYARLFLARLDPPSGRLEYVNAGHDRPLLVCVDGVWSRLEMGGTVIGAFPETAYRQGTAVLAPGACLLVFSDGISDAWSDPAEADRHLVYLVRTRSKGDPAQLRAQILDAAKQTHDDRTLIILERLAGDARSARR
jgi:phosphoserine phosphatase RsbU/P